MTSINNENNQDTINEKYEILNIDGENYFKCKQCDFYTKHKYSMIRHFNSSKDCSIKYNLQCELCHKEFRDIRDKERHLSRKKKCAIVPNTEEESPKIENEPIEQNTNTIALTKKTPILSANTQNAEPTNNIEINILKEKLSDARKEIDKLKKENKKLEDDTINSRINIFTLYADSIVDKFNKKNNSNSILYKYELEYNILYSSLFKYKVDITDCNKEKIKSRLFLLFDIVNDELLKNLVYELRDNHKEYRPFIREYRDILLKKEKNGEKKINGRYISVYKIDLNRILEKE
jgi:uncharacterized C2H2 Zn-finger protein